MVNIPKSNIDTKYKTERALVDIVAQDGLEWIKVYTVCLNISEIETLCSPPSRPSRLPLNLAVVLCSAEENA